MELDHFANIHAINVIGAENSDHMRLGLFDQIDVLVNGVGGPAIPVFARGSHLGGNRDDEMIPQQAGGFPSFAQVLEERLAFELDQDVHRIDARVDQVAEDEVDNPIAASKRNGGFGTFL